MGPLKNSLYLSFLTTFVVIVWVVFSIIHNFTVSTISEDTSIQITPIPASFDNRIIDEIKKRKNISVNLGEQLISSSAPTPTPKVSTNPQINSSGSAEENTQKTSEETNL